MFSFFSGQTKHRPFGRPAHDAGFGLAFREPPFSAGAVQSFSTVGALNRGFLQQSAEANGAVGIWRLSFQIKDGVLGALLLRKGIRFFQFHDFIVGQVAPFQKTSWNTAKDAKHEIRDVLTDHALATAVSFKVWTRALETGVSL
jgi:hypothetical protein